MESSKTLKTELVKSVKAGDNESTSIEKDSNADPEDLPQCSKSANSILNGLREQAKEAANNSNDQMTEEDEKRLVYLSNLSEPALAAYIQELDTEIYELGLREARELSRSKHLRVFSNARRRATKRE